MFSIIVQYCTCSPVWYTFIFKQPIIEKVTFHAVVSIVEVHFQTPLPRWLGCRRTQSRYTPPAVWPHPNRTVHAGRPGGIGRPDTPWCRWTGLFSPSKTPPVKGCRKWGCIYWMSTYKKLTNVPSVSFYLVVFNNWELARGFFIIQYTVLILIKVSTFYIPSRTTPL